MTAGPFEQAERRPVRPRNRALCCECGELRTVAQSYRGRPPVSIAADGGAGPWCTWLRCTYCQRTTLHALILDAIAGTWGPDGCDRERHDRNADRCRRRIGRRLHALAAEGVKIVNAPSAEDMKLDDALVEVIEYADAPAFLVRVRATAAPSRLLEAVELAEDLLDEPDRLGPWADDAAGVWRGLAIVAR